MWNKLRKVFNYSCGVCSPANLDKLGSSVSRKKLLDPDSQKVVHFRFAIIGLVTRDGFFFCVCKNSDEFVS